MSGKLLFVFQSGPENRYNVLWGLRMAQNTWTHPYGDEHLESVKVLLFGRGVSLLNPKLPESPEYEESLHQLVDAGIEVSACISIAEPQGLVGDAENLGVKLVHASQYIIDKVNEGYAIMNF